MENKSTHKGVDPTNFASLVSGANQLVDPFFMQAYATSEHLKSRC